MAETTRNRKERRATAQNGRSAAERPAADIPLSQPDRSGPKSKTLFELAEERQELLAKGQPFDKKRDEQDRVLRPSDTEDGDVSDSPIGHLGDAIFFTLTLSMLHFTLDVLVYNQYRQSIEWRPIFVRTGKLTPVLFTIIYLLRSRTASTFPVLRQIFYLCTAVAAGCHMIYVGNKYDYYAVMKRAPPLGTLWIWSVIEMRLPYALLSVAIDAGYLWLKGFSVF